MVSPTLMHKAIEARFGSFDAHLQGHQGPNSQNPLFI